MKHYKRFMMMTIMIVIVVVTIIFFFPVNGSKKAVNVMGVFTGMEILNADRIETHAVGIQPDIFMERTINGVTNGEEISY